MRNFMMMAALLLTSMNAMAQFEPGKFSIQPKLGITCSYLTHQPNLYFLDEPDLPEIANYNLKKSVYIGGLIGAEAEYQFDEKFSVTGELSYVMQGAQWRDFSLHMNRGTLNIDETKLELGYISMPFTAKYIVWKGLALKTGVQFAYLLNAKFKSKISFDFSNSNVSMNTKVDESFKSECKKFDFSIPIGLSYEFNNHLILDARYNIGLTNVTKREDENGNLKNRVFMLSLGYKLKL